MNNVDAMRVQLIKDFSRAWEVNDGAHRIGHFAEVEAVGNRINDTLKLGFDPKLIMLVAYFHDMYAWSRFNHHLMSGEWVRTTDHPLIAELNEEERVLVAAGCREHRASGKDPFTCDFAELMCSADRGFPTNDVEILLSRAIQCRLAKGDSPEAARAGAIIHMKEKFGSQGYARYPRFYEQTFAAELVLQRRMVDEL